MITVTLRQRPGPNDKIYLYLDYYPALFDPVTRRSRRRQYLHMSLYARPANTIQKEYNRRTLSMAEIIRCRKSLELSSSELGIYSESVRKMSFIEFFEMEASGHRIAWKTACKRFSTFMNGECSFGQITPGLCEDFRTWLLDKATAMGHPDLQRAPRKISVNTASQMYMIFCRVVKDAYRNNRLQEDISKNLHKIPARKTCREYLTMDEVRTLWETPCLYGVLKDASMFSIFTGLRISDILSLNWDEIKEAPDGKPCIMKVMKKTDTPSTIFISEEALRFCGPRRPGRRVFPELRRSMTEKPLQKWISRAGIQKHITFHCFRHTNATLMLAGGADIMAVSGQLTHTSIRTTEIYSHLVDANRRAASEIISLEK